MKGGQRRLLWQEHRHGKTGERTDDKIERAAAADPDAPLLTREQLATGTTVEAEGKVAISLRVDRSVLEAYKAAGKGWQTRMNDALAAAIAEDSAEPRDALRALELTMHRAASYVRDLKRSVVAERAPDAGGLPAAKRTGSAVRRKQK